MDRREGKRGIVGARARGPSGMPRVVVLMIESLSFIAIVTCINLNGVQLWEPWIERHVGLRILVRSID
jgi:hypothetical protein